MACVIVAQPAYAPTSLPGLLSAGSAVLVSESPVHLVLGSSIRVEGAVASAGAGAAGGGSMDGSLTWGCLGEGLERRGVDGSSTWGVWVTGGSASSGGSVSSYSPPYSSGCWRKQSCIVLGLGWGVSFEGLEGFGERVGFLGV